MSADDGFKAQIDATMAFEGGYVNDPDDAGGETNFGISKRSYPQVDIRNLTLEAAKSIYFRDFWLRPGLRNLPPAIGAKVFDLGVNMGPRSAVKLLQASLNALGATPELGEDGLIGMRTTIASQEFTADDVLAELRAQARQHYLNIATVHPAMAKYLRGWIRRAEA